MKIASTTTRLALASVISLIMAPARAQPDSPAGGGFDEVIVTAQKRVENIQDVPISISAISADQIEARGIMSLDDINSLPNVKFERAPSSKSIAVIAMRGSVTFNPSILWEPAVGLYVDGVYIAKAQGSMYDVVDLERVEVLRGPQGTLYGRNTLAGAVNLVTKKPTGELGGSAEVGYGNYNENRAKVSLDLPKVGVFSAKIAGSMRQRDGVVDIEQNPFPQVVAAGASPSDETDTKDQKNFLGQLHADFSEAFTADYTYNYNKFDEKPPFSQTKSVLTDGDPRAMFDPGSPGYIGFGPVPPNGLYFGFPLDLYVQPDYSEEGSINVPTYERSKTEGHALVLTYDLGGLTLKSTTSYREMTWGDRLDLDGSPLPLADTIRDTDYDAFSQELQITGNAFDDKLNYVGGVFYFDETAETLGPQSFFGGAALGGATYQSDYGVKTKSYAVYGQFDYALTEDLTLTLGGRYTDEEKQAQRYLRVANASTAALPGGSLVVADFDYGSVPKAKFHNFSPAISLAYAINDDVNVYWRFAKGYKSGGYNGETNSFFEFTADCPSGATELCDPYKAEEVDSFEWGIKSRLFDDHMILNVSTFYDKHKQIQVPVFKASGAVSSEVLNAASGTVYGYEVEMNLKPVDALTLNASFSYLHAEYDEYNEFGTDVADNRAYVHAPKYSASLGAEWHVAQWDFADLNIYADVNYVDDYYTFPYALQQPAATDPDYGSWAEDAHAQSRTIVNARAALSQMKLGGMDAELAVWAHNLTDENRTTNFIPFGAGFGGMLEAYYTEPRTYGVTLGVKF
jgi:iron complex outermembrane receptor protein